MLMKPGSGRQGSRARAGSWGRDSLALATHPKVIFVLVTSCMWLPVGLMDWLNEPLGASGKMPSPLGFWETKTIQRNRTASLQRVPPLAPRSLTSKEDQAQLSCPMPAAQAF